MKRYAEFTNAQQVQPLNGQIVVGVPGKLRGTFRAWSIADRGEWPQAGRSLFADEVLVVSCDKGDISRVYRVTIYQAMQYELAGEYVEAADGMFVRADSL